MPRPPIALAVSPQGLLPPCGGCCHLAARGVGAVALDYRAAELPGLNHRLESRMEPKPAALLTLVFYSPFALAVLIFPTNGSVQSLVIGRSLSCTHTFAWTLRLLE